MGKFLLKCGIPAVICINTMSKTTDVIIRIFQKIVYDKLLSGSTLQVAFDEAVNVCRQENDYELSVCCCSHEHSSDCKWYQYAHEFGFEKAHNLHSKVCSCNLELNQHKWTCTAIKEFNKYQISSRYHVPKFNSDGESSDEISESFDFDDNIS